MTFLLRFHSRRAVGLWLQSGARRLRTFCRLGTALVTVLPLAVTAQPVERAPLLASAWPGFSSDSAYALAYDGNYAYLVSVGGPPSGLEVFDVRDISQPRHIAELPNLGACTGIALQGRYALITSTVVSAGYLSVVDISNPANPQLVAFWPLTGPSGPIAVQNTYAYMTTGPYVSIVDITHPTAPNLVGHINASPNGIAVQGNYAYLADTSYGFRVFDISNPSSPRFVALIRGAYQRLRLQGNTAFLEGTSFDIVSISDPTNPVLVHTYPKPPSAIGIVGSYAYIGDGPYLDVLELSDSTNPQLVTNVLIGQTVSDIAVQSGVACLALGYGGFGLLDVSSPATPQGFTQIGGLVSARDVALQGNYAYVADYTTGLQVLDISNPTNVQRAGCCPAGAGAFGVAVSGNYAYLAADYYGIVVVNIQDPHHPQPIGGYTNSGFYFSGVVQQTNYVFGLAYRYDYYANLYYYSVHMLSTTNPAAPQLVGFYEDVWSPSSLALHSGYLYVTSGYALNIFDLNNPFDWRLVFNTTEFGGPMAIQGDYAYFSHGYLQTVDISSPTSPQLVGQSSRSDNGFRIAVQGGYACTAGASGLHVFDISQPVRPTRVGAFGQYLDNSPPYPYGLKLAGDYAFIANGGPGLQVVDISKTAAPESVGAWSTNSTAVALATSGPLALLGNNYSPSLYIIGWTDVQSTQPLGTCALAAAPSAVVAQSNYAYIADSTLEVVDISNPQNPTVVGHLNANAPTGGLAVRGSLAYMTQGTNMLVIDVSNPASPQAVDTFSWSVRGEWLWGLDLDSNLLLVASSPPGLKVVDIQNAVAPRARGSVFTGGNAHSVAALGRYALLADGPAGLQVIDLVNPDSPLRVGGYLTDSPALTVAVSGTYAYVATAYGGVVVLDVSVPLNPRHVGSNSTYDPNMVAFGQDKVLLAAGIDGLAILNSFAPLNLAPMNWSSASGFTFVVRGTPGLTLQAQRSADLRSWTNWGSQFILAPGPVQLTDAQATNAARFFYRALVP